MTEPGDVLLEVDGINVSNQPLDVVYSVVRGEEVCTEHVLVLACIPVATCEHMESYDVNIIVSLSALTNQCGMREQGTACKMVYRRSPMNGRAGNDYSVTILRQDIVAATASVRHLSRYVFCLITCSSWTTVVLVVAPWKQYSAAPTATDHLWRKFVFLDTDEEIRHINKMFA